MIFFAFFLGLQINTAKAQSASQKDSVLVSGATVSGNSITISWAPFSGATNYTIYRKLKNATSWGTSIGSTTSNSFTDNLISAGTYYEYKIVRSSSVGTGYGYLASGKEIAPVDFRGRLILLVDNTFTTLLATELSQLESDLQMDSWIVTRIDVSRNDTVSNIKELVRTAYNQDQANTKALLMVGHVPVPYSGNLNPDGHPDHLGAWPADSYYGEFIGTWTDNSVNSQASQSTRNHNIPGDGKFDQSNFPATPVLQVGRIDLYRVAGTAGAAFQYYQGIDEEQALRSYLNKLHNFKIKQFTPQYRGIVFDNFHDYNSPLAAGGYKSITSLVGSANTTDANTDTSTKFKDMVNNQSYLWTYASGGGSWVSSNNVGTTNEYAAPGYQFGGIFNMTFGSYFGDFDCGNNFLVAPLAAGALTNVWSGVPNWYFHHMGMGDNIGYSYLASIKNVDTYVSQSGYLGGVNDTAYYTSNRVQMNLLGDPSLRQVMVSPPTNLQVTNNGGNARFSWSASSNPGLLGYYIYEITPSTVSRLTSSPVTSPYNSAIPFISGKAYMVKAVKLETSTTGTYYNTSLGTKANASGISPIKVSAKVLLSGPYNSGAGLMKDSLRTLGLIPLSSPYASIGYMHTANNRNETVQSSVFSVSGANAIVDWIIVELRNSSSNTVVASRSGLLQRDGDITEIDGVSPLEFDMPAGSYKISIRHRVHLGIMSASAYNLTSTPTAVDFTSINVYGTNARNASNLLWGGNTNFDNVVKYSGTSNDRDIILNTVGPSTPSRSISGYLLTDLNMNGVTKYTGSRNDRDIILTNVGSATPNNIITQQLP